ncbi:MAG: hypothetical protein M5U28_19165 [Sandaracinaceae bacterium]|nr:hypothetical protein [Sandaracinaceae bacterium]
MARTWMAALAVLLLSGCSGGGGASAGPAESGGGEATIVIDEDDPRVSQSAGVEGGVTVLFPRVMGLPGAEPAALQAHMVELARRLFPDRPIDVRPDPERVCPRAGCNGVSLGALLIVRDGSCATVGIVGGPGATDLTLTRWSGRLIVRDRVIPFREPPESHVVLQDSSPCDQLVEHLTVEDYAVEEALRAAAGRTLPQ